MAKLMPFLSALQGTDNGCQNKSRQSFTRTSTQRIKTTTSITMKCHVSCSLLATEWKGAAHFALSLFYWYIFLSRTVDNTGPGLWWTEWDRTVDSHLQTVHNHPPFYLPPRLAWWRRREGTLPYSLLFWAAMGGSVEKIVTVTYWKISAVWKENIRKVGGHVVMH